jgi:hypothetical protein
LLSDVFGLKLALTLVPVFVLAGALFPGLAQLRGRRSAPSRQRRARERLRKFRCNLVRLARALTLHFPRRPDVGVVAVAAMTTTTTPSAVLFALLLGHPCQRA